MFCIEGIVHKASLERVGDCASVRIRIYPIVTHGAMLRLSEE